MFSPREWVLKSTNTSWMFTVSMSNGIVWRGQGYITAKFKQVKIMIQYPETCSQVKVMLWHVHKSKLYIVHKDVIW